MSKIKTPITPKIIETSVLPMTIKERIGYDLRLGTCTGSKIMMPAMLE
jgi:hypothetical protein